MKNITTIIVGLLLSFTTTPLFAHALWIETTAAGKVGQKQSVKVFYGEYATNERDSIAKWYSDVKECTLWLIGPDLKKTELKLTPGVNHFEGAFTPDQNGAYTLVVSHEAKELGGTTKYHFLSSANVIVGKSTPIVTQNPNVLKLHVDGISVNPKVNKPIQLTALIQDAAAKGKTVSVFSPNGWSKELTTDENGKVVFIPLWAGRYVIEVSDMDNIAGQHYGKDFAATWKGATYSFEVR